MEEDGLDVMGWRGEGRGWVGVFAVDSEFESEFEIDRVTVSRELHCVKL